jgi:hypothetical protein
MPSQFNLTIPSSPGSAPPDFSMSSLLGGGEEPPPQQSQAPAAGPPPDEMRDEDVVDMGTYDGPPLDDAPAPRNAAVQTLADVTDATARGLYDFGAGLWSTVNPVPLVMEIARSSQADWAEFEKSAQAGDYPTAMTHLLRSLPLAQAAKIAGAIGQKHIDTLRQAREEWKKGNTSEAFGYAAASVLPLIGPAAAVTGKRLGDGEISFMRAFGEGAGLVLPIALKGIQAPAVAGQIARAKQLGAGIPGVVKAAVPLSANAAERAAVAAFADANDIALKPGERTGNPVMQGIEQLNENTSMLGSMVGTMSRAQRATKMQEAGKRIGDQIAPLETPQSAGEAAGQAMAAVDVKIGEKYRKVGESIASRVDPLSKTALQAGTDVYGKFKTKLEELATVQDENYEAWREGINDPKFTTEVVVGYETGTMPTSPGFSNLAPATARVPITEAVQLPVFLQKSKRQLTDVYKSILGDPRWTLPRRQNSPAFSAIEQLVNGPDVVGIEHAEQMLGAVKELAREHGGTAKRAVRELQHAVDYTMKQADPKLFEALEKGRAATKAYHAAAEVLAQIKGQATRARHPETGQPVVTITGEAAKLPEHLLGKADQTLELLQSVLKETPEAAPIIGRWYLDDLFTPALDGGFDFRRVNDMARKWNNLGVESKRLLYKDPGTLRQVELLFTQARKASEKGFGDTNPSAVKGFDALVLPRDTGIERLQAVSKVAKDVPAKIGRAWLEQALTKMGEKGFDIQHGQRLFTSWNAMGPKTKAMLFGSNVENLDAFFRLASDASYHANPSKTAFISGLGVKIVGALALSPAVGYSEVGQGVLAALLWNPKFSKALVGAMKTPKTARAASATAAARVMNMIRDSGLARPGVNAVVQDDQRGREDAAVVDMGTYEEPPPPTPGQ